ncbi:MAG TPA: hypothetical protein VFM98_01855 [Ramlibacter sp.]|uniref:hypothetical protein n=1 Tax=Ramlibacter sp. TaxID=1917967 RepID=UPI002D7E6347|nr:hypothetical protein [Ramlibacter sp.]HET8744320.1 hypothetical protein [Ramlibacter sp.]
MNRHRRVLLLLLPLAACTPAADPVAVDQCALQEYLEECEAEFATPEEAAACRAKAPTEATRIAAGIPQECRPKT